MDDPSPLEEATATTWAHWLAPLLGHESIGRATLVGDQVRGAMDHWQQTGQSTIVALCDESKECGLLHTRPTEKSDSVTVLCGGTLGLDRDRASRHSPGHSEDTIQGFSESLKHRWAQRKIRIAFWSTGTEQKPSASSAIPQQFGFRHLADLSYQSLEFASLPEPLSLTDPSPLPDDSRSLPDGPRSKAQCSDSDDRMASTTAVRLKRVEADQWDAFEQMVGQTYIGSADCPAINQYRSAAETLAGYRDAPAYAPDHWFWCVEPNSDDSEMDESTQDKEASNERIVGCVILGLHGSDQKNSKIAVEIIYMALLPDHRGRGLGRCIFNAVVDQYRDFAHSLILAVDTTNEAAASLYEKAGFSEVFRERLWFWHESMR